ncbi:MAG TPA: DNA polymerase IV [Polyangiaceae bacterium]|nr:DNA polymerase IV [Polyangiaceae bacterium]
MRARFILHADMDAFYASIEQRDHPELRGKPVIVGATSPRGVVAAASYEARKFGVRSAMPGFEARRLCPNGIFLPSNMARYVEVSDQVHAVFETFTPLIEPLALDEAFLDISGSVGLFGGALELGKKLRARVRQETELAVSVGIAPCKLVAKIACTSSKPDGLRLIAAEEVRAFLAPLPIRRLWGVGPITAAELERAGFKTLAALAALPPERALELLGQRGYELSRLARGEDDREVVSDRAAKSCGEENTFEHDVSDRETIASTITAHAEAVARRLRRSGLRGRTVTLKIKLARRKGERSARVGQLSEPIYPLLSRQKTLPMAIDDGARIREVALALWDAEALAEPVRLIGVSLSGLETTANEQLDLFPPPRDPLGPVLDEIQERFGKGAIRRAVVDPDKVTPTLQRKRGD